MLVVIHPKDPEQHRPASGVLTLLCEMHMPTCKHDTLLHGNNRCKQAFLTNSALSGCTSMTTSKLHVGFWTDRNRSKGQRYTVSARL